MGLLDDIARATPEYVERRYAGYRPDAKSGDERWALSSAGYELAGATGGRGAGPHARLPIADLVHSYRELGHVIADLDPLGHSPRAHALLSLEEFGFTQGDLDRAVTWEQFRGGERGPLRELVAALEQ